MRRFIPAKVNVNEPAQKRTIAEAKDITAAREDFNKSSSDETETITTRIIMAQKNKIVNAGNVIAIPKAPPIAAATIPIKQANIQGVKLRAKDHIRLPGLTLPPRSITKKERKQSPPTIIIMPTITLTRKIQITKAAEDEKPTAARHMRS
jgi:hypothetical protein